MMPENLNRKSKRDRYIFFRCRYTSIEFLWYIQAVGITQEGRTQLRLIAGWLDFFVFPSLH
uniref:Uncharacterized protein n=1 Tax=Daphnia magna TaxID=35525 RepID=A0A0P6ECL2_9CRUS